MNKTTVTGTTRFATTITRDRTRGPEQDMTGPVWRAVRDWLDMLSAIVESLPEYPGAALDAAISRIEAEDVAYGLGRDGSYSVTATLDPDATGDQSPTTFTIIDRLHAPF